MLIPPSRSRNRPPRGARYAPISLTAKPRRQQSRHTGTIQRIRPALGPTNETQSMITEENGCYHDHFPP
jgi:hypothetical protein